MAMHDHSRTWTRWLRHVWLDAADARRAVTPAGLQRLEEAVRRSETRHRGELRLCVEGGLPASALWRGMGSRQRAAELFSGLRVWDTAHNNGVLIYLLLADHRIEILADRGLTDRVPAAVWQDMADRLGQAMARGEPEQGMALAVDEVGALMRAHYPLTPGERNVNELPDAGVLL